MIRNSTTRPPRRSQGNLDESEAKLQGVQLKSSLLPLWETYEFGSSQLIGEI